MRAGTLVVDIAANVARLQTDMASAKGVVASAMNDITRSVNVAKTALGALGVGLGAGALASMVLGINKATAALDDMAEITGSTVENLSRFSVVAKIGSHDMGLVEDSLVKLTKGLKGTEEETKNARQALEFLGVQAKTSAGNLRDPGEIMKEVSGKLAQFQDGAGKTALALDLFGKSGAKLLPFLKDMAEEGTVAARVTAEQAAQAEILEKNLKRLQTAGEDAKRTFVVGFTPALIDFTQKLIDAQKAGGNLATTLLLVATNGKTLAEIDADITARQKSIDGRSTASKILGAGMALGPLGPAMAIAGVGPFADAADQSALSVLYRQRDFLRLQQRRAADEVVDPLATSKASANYTSQGKARGTGAGGATGKTAADLLNEQAGVSKDFNRDLGLLHAEYAAGRMELDQYRGAVEKLIEKQAFAKELERQHKDEIKKHTDASREAFDAEQRRGAQMIEFGNTARAEIKQLEFENSLIELNNVEREKAIAFRKIENEFMKARKGLSDEEVESLRLEADVAKERLGALIDAKAAREGARDSSKAASDEWLRSQSSMWQSIDRTAHDTFVSIFDSGKSAFDRLKDTLKNGLFDLLYQMTARPFLIQIATAIGGAGVAQSAFGSSGGGMFGGLLGGGGGGVGLGIGNLASLGSSAYSAFTGNSLVGSIGSALGFGSGGAGALAAAELAGLTGSGVAFGGALGTGAAAGLSFLGPIGLGIGALALMGAFGGGGGGPKDSEIFLGHTGGGWENPQFGLTFNNSPSGPGAAAGMIAALNDPAQYDPQTLNQLIGPVWGGTKSFGAGPEENQSLLSQMEAYLAPARAAAQSGQRAEAATTAAANQMLLAKFAGGAVLADSLKDYQDSQSVSEYLSPEDRLSGARSLFDSAVERAGAGDADAARSLPGFANVLLGVGRENYASGAQFQSLRAEVNDRLAAVLEKQGETQASLLADMPVALRESSKATLDQLKKIFEVLKEGFATMNLQAGR